MTIIIPDVVGGVQDYASLLAREWMNSVTVLRIRRSQASNLRKVSGAVFLQYSGYGYSQRGAPLWLLKWALSRPRSAGGFGVYFHELFAHGPPWSSSFWLSPVQQYVVRRLARRADWWITNCADYSRWLQGVSGPRPSATLATPSNIGELAVPANEREPYVIVFGGKGIREATYAHASGRIFQWAAMHGLAIHDIGPPLAVGEQNNLRRRGVRIHGRVDAVEVSRLLARASFGLIAYGSQPLAKSSVFAAYCSHAVCPVVLGSVDSAADGLNVGQQFIRVGGDSQTHLDARAVGEAAHRWYQGHTIARHVETISRLAT